MKNVVAGRARRIAIPLFALPLLAALLVSGRCRLAGRPRRKDALIRGDYRVTATAPSDVVETIARDFGQARTSTASFAI